MIGRRGDGFVSASPCLRAGLFSASPRLLIPLPAFVLLCAANSGFQLVTCGCPYLQVSLWPDGGLCRSGPAGDIADDYLQGNSHQALEAGLYFPGPLTSTETGLMFASRVFIQRFYMVISFTRMTIWILRR